MRVLVTGANGFIGAHVVSALVEAEFSVVRAVRRPVKDRMPGDEICDIAVDFNDDTSPADWAPRLAGVDAVINCAGILQGRRRQDMKAIHVDAPRALFEACESAGVRRIIQVSAMGIDADTQFARSKRASDRGLDGMDLDWVILRPSLVYAEGSFGGTSLIRGLAGFPGVVPLIGDGRQMFRPIHARDLADGMIGILRQPGIRQVIMEPAGPEELNMREILRCYRRWLGFGQARFLPVPLALASAVAKLGDWFGHGPVNTTALRQLEHGNSTASTWFMDATGVRPSTMAQWLDRSPSHVQDRWHARLYWLAPWIRLTLAGVWIWLGIVLASAEIIGPGMPVTASSLMGLAVGLLMAAAGVWGLVRPGNSRIVWALTATILAAVLGVALGAFELPGMSGAGVLVLATGVAPLIVTHAVLSNPR